MEVIFAEDVEEIFGKRPSGFPFEKRLSAQNFQGAGKKPEEKEAAKGKGGGKKR